MDFIKRTAKSHRHWLSGLLQFDISQLVVPQQCYLCHQPSTNLCCEFCDADLPRTSMLQSAPHQPDLLLNPKLKTSLAKPEFQLLIAPMRYRWPVSNLLQDFKYHRKDTFAGLFAQWMLTPIQQMSPRTQPDLLVPVPIHPLRQLGRYYNQAELLANILSAQLHIPTTTQLVKRISYQRSQTRLSGKARRKHLQNAFAVNEKTAGQLSSLAMQRIAIVDDVITTASTVNAVAKVLKRRFPTVQIDVWAVAISA